MTDMGQKHFLHGWGGILVIALSLALAAPVSIVIDSLQLSVSPVWLRWAPAVLAVLILSVNGERFQGLRRGEGNWRDVGISSVIGAAAVSLYWLSVSLSI